MFAIIDSPGGQHFDYHGPVSKLEAAVWAYDQVRRIANETTQNVFYTILTNKAALSMRYEDKSFVIPR